MNDGHNRLCGLLMRYLRMHRRVVEGRIRSLDIHPSQHFLLMQLSSAGPMPSQAQLAEMMDVSPASVARTLKKLDETTAMRPKKGFPVPFRNWIREEKYSRLLLDAFKSESCSRFFDTDKLIKLLSDHICEKANHGRVLYTVYAFTVWYERYFNDDHERTKQHET